METSHFKNSRKVTYRPTKHISYKALLERFKNSLLSGLNVKPKKQNRTSVLNKIMHTLCNTDKHGSEIC